MTVDISKIKLGDEVTVRAKVTSTDNVSWVDISLFTCPGPYSIAIQDIATHTPAPRRWKVGDMATWGAKVRNYEIVAIRGDQVSLWNEDLGFAHSYIKCLEEPSK